MHVIAAKAVAFHEALEPGFSRAYQQHRRRQRPAHGRGPWRSAATTIVSGGTDNHLFLLDLIATRTSPAKDADAALGRANITVNKNAVPNDPRSPFVTSGLRLGTPAITTRGFGPDEVTTMTHWIADILGDISSEEMIDRVRGQVLELCGRFPVYRVAPAAARAAAGA